MRAHILIEREDGSVRLTVLDDVTEATLTVTDSARPEPTRYWIDAGKIVSTSDYDGKPDEPDGAPRIKPTVSYHRIDPRERTPEEQAVFDAAAEAARQRHETR